MLIQIAQFLLGLSLLIILHEFGHFIPAKLFGARVEKFYLFFDYKFSLIKKRIGDTVYGIGWIPLGGYVKISGMVDESMDTEGLGKDPEPWEFRAKPAWQRLIILTGGVIVNFVLAIVIYAGMSSYYGEEYLPIANVENGLQVSEGLQKLGLQNGDLIIEVGGRPIERVSDIAKSLVVGLDEEIVVLRNGERLTFQMDGQTIRDIIDSGVSPVGLRVPYVVAAVIDTLPAATAGIQVGDSLVALNGAPLYFFDEYLDEVPKHKNDTVTVDFYRNGQLMSASMLLDSTGKMGVSVAGDILKYYKTEHVKYKGMDAVAAGYDRAVSQLDYYVRQFKVIFSSETGAASKLGGFKTMMDQYEEGSWDWQRFWGVTAFISIMLGFLNILPIPALDGGHVMFTLIEMVTGRKPSIKVLEYSQMIGFFLLLALLIFANGNDFGLWDIFK